MTWQQDFLQWCKDERQRALDSLKFMDDAQLRLREATGGGPLIDVTDEHAKLLRRTVENMDALIKRVEADLA